MQSFVDAFIRLAKKDTNAQIVKTATEKRHMEWAESAKKQGKLVEEIDTVWKYICVNGLCFEQLANQLKDVDIETADQIYYRVHLQNCTLKYRVRPESSTKESRVRILRPMCSSLMKGWC